MNITPNDILMKEFDSKFRGYDVEQVNDYLDVIVVEVERLHGEINELKQQLDVAKEKNEYFAQLQDSLNSSILIAQEAADRLKDNARKEAELILYDAEREADARVRSANDHAQDIITETEALRRNSHTFRQQLEAMIRKQLDLVTSEEYIELFDEKQTVQPSQPESSSAQRANERLESLTQAEEANFEKANELKIDPAMAENLPDNESVVSETIRIELPNDDE